jgi:hypothetical protein
MKEFINRIFGSPMLALVTFGTICLILGATDVLQVGSVRLQINSAPGRVVLAIAGIVLILAGFFVLWMNRGRDTIIGHQYGWGVEVKKIHCKGTMKDLYLLSGETINKMPPERSWKYELSDIIIKKYLRDIAIDFTIKVKYPDKKSSTDIFTCLGMGTLNGTLAYVKYGFYSNSQKEIDPDWSGVMVLKIPNEGKIRGVWLTTSTNKDSNFPLGTISLSRKASIE